MRPDKYWLMPGGLGGVCVWKKSKQSVVIIMIKTLFNNGHLGNRLKLFLIKISWHIIGSIIVWRHAGSFPFNGNFILLRRRIWKLKYPFPGFFFFITINSVVFAIAFHNYVIRYAFFVNQFRNRRTNEPNSSTSVYIFLWLQITIEKLDCIDRIGATVHIC